MRPPRPGLPGFYAILDTAYVALADWESKALDLLNGGACLLQVRAKDKTPGEIRQLAQRILPACRDHGVPLIINDHLEIALSLPEAGLHLGQEDGDIAGAREALGPDRMLGLSTHSLEQARAALSIAGSLSYFAVGPIFATGTKPTYIPVGTGLIRKIRDLDPPLPFFCIGGINRDNLDEVIAAGARGVVAVSDPLLAPDTANATRSYVQRLRSRAHA